MQWKINGAETDKYRCLYEPTGGLGPVIGAESAMLVLGEALIVVWDSDDATPSLRSHAATTRVRARRYEGPRLKVIPFLSMEASPPIADELYLQAAP